MTEVLHQGAVVEGLFRVFLLDDHDIVRRGLSDLLSAKRDITVVGDSDSAERATRNILELKPDVMVLDLGLPDIDGWEVARQLKASELTSSIPIIALTAASLPHERVSAMRAGCDRHLTKPCAPAALVAEIRRLIDDIV